MRACVCVHGGYEVVRACPCVAGGPTPHPGFGGPKRSKICPSRLCAHRTRIRIWSVRWGRSAGARCETRRRRALACVRAARGVYNRQRASRPKPRRSKTTACVSLPSCVPIYVRPCVNLWVPTAHLQPAHSAERTVEACCQRLQPCERTRSPANRPAVRTRTRHRMARGLHSSPLCE